MIRYVLAALLTVALIAIAMPAVDRAAAVNSERQAERAVARVSEAAVSLAETEELPPRGEPGPRRFVTVALPSRSLTSAPVVTLRFRSVTPNRSVGVYRVAGRREHLVRVPVAVTDADGEPVRLGGTTGEMTLKLTLEHGASGEPVVVVQRV